MIDAEAFDAFRMIRWAHTEGKAVCPHWRCKACFKQFSITSGTLFASRKLRSR